MGEIKRYYENGQWHEYESVWDGRELLPAYESKGAFGSGTAKILDDLQHSRRAPDGDKRAPKEGYRLAGRLRRKAKAA